MSESREPAKVLTKSDQIKRKKSPNIRSNRSVAKPTLVSEMRDRSAGRSNPTSHSREFVQRV